MFFCNLRFPVTALLILGFLITRPISGAGQIAAHGVRSAALGNAGTALDGGPWIRANPSLTAHLEERRFELFGSRSFEMSELQLAAGALAIPSSRSALTMTARTFGFSEYRDTQLGFGYARELPGEVQTNASAGLAVIYDHRSIAGYESRGKLGIILGGSVRLSSTLLLGMQAANIHRSVDAASSSLPQQLAVGLGYRPSKSTRLLLDLRKEMRYPLAIHAGLEVQPSEVLALRIGIATGPRLFTVGIGISPGAVRGGLAFLYHYALGWSPAVSVGTEF